MAFTYTGDFLDMLYTRLDAGDTLENITFDIYVPQDTIAFMDSLVIPKKARHLDAAHAFIDFFVKTRDCLFKCKFSWLCNHTSKMLMI